jgi:hypothetical protein
MKKTITTIALAVAFTTSAYAQAAPHKYYVYHNKSADKHFVMLNFKQDSDEPNRVFVRMAQEDDAEFAADITKIRTCFERLLDAINDPMSALVTMYTNSTGGVLGSANGYLRARNSNGGMIQKSVVCDSPKLGRVHIF